MHHKNSHSATHPSDHNTILIEGEEDCREQRIKEQERRRNRDMQKFKGYKHGNKKNAYEERLIRNKNHEQAFMAPVPLQYDAPSVSKLCAGVGLFHSQNQYV